MSGFFHIFDKDKFAVLLTEYQKVWGKGDYQDKIPYSCWRSLRKSSTITVTSFSKEKNARVTFSDEKDNKLYSTTFNDGGFGDFFYINVIREDRFNLLNYNDKTPTILSNDTIVNNTIETNPPWAFPDENPSKYILDNDKKTQALYWNCSYGDSKIQLDEFLNKVEKDNQLIDKNNTGNSKNNKKENDSMMKGFNFDFGACGSTVRMSMYGLAIKNVSDEWVSYNPTTKEIVNVDVFNIPDGGKYMYKMPVAINDVAIGDVVIHNRVPMFVTAINENGTFEVVDVRAGETKSIIPTRNMFGFNFMTKVVSLFNSFTTAPSQDNPFGNMLPFLMMNGENEDSDAMLMFMMMQGQNGSTNMFSNPMMMYFLMKDNKGNKNNKDIDPMMMMMLMGGMGTTQNHTHTHTCSCHNS